MRTSKQPILVIEENPRQRTRQTRSWQPRQISCRTIKSHPIRQASAGRGSYQDTPSGVPYAREEDVIGFSRLPEIQIYNFVTNCRNKRRMLLTTGPREIAGSSLSPAQLRRARRFRPCPYSFLYVRVFYRAGTGAVSSTFASRKNFAASSGGVGLI
jgi:hypothetical protein